MRHNRTEIDALSVTLSIAHSCKSIRYACSMLVQVSTPMALSLVGVYIPILILIHATVKFDKLRNCIGGYVDITYHGVLEEVGSFRNPIGDK